MVHYRRRAASFLVLCSLLIANGISPSLANPLPAVQEICQRIDNKLTSVSLQECLSFHFQLDQGVSVNGSPLIYRDFHAVGGRKPLGKILLLGGIHGDEYASISIVFKWLKTLEEHHRGLFEWRIYPLTNPDGLLRKDPTRTNAHGVDLNRNFATPNWEKESTHYWHQQTGKDPRRFPGKTALSEPEAQWITREIDRYKPDIIVSVHAPYNLLDFDGPPSSPPKRLGSLVLSPLGTFPGSLGRYSWSVKNIPLITIELPHAGILPSPANIQQIWNDMVGWMQNHLKKGKRPISK
ncbi:MAG: murein peptide amidase A [Magnetococcales bacterium]|nr:succinylglutamate desuccinylase/aspartoacylase family protein [Magnetococcales bacterium]NGZ25803.1 murein peptide amidase A [Magnetococcales bacterium]